MVTIYTVRVLIILTRICIIRQQMKCFELFCSYMLVHVMVCRILYYTTCYYVMLDYNILLDY